MGPRGTITPFHHDLTNNFMAQVIGRKRIKLASSWDIPLMRNYLHCFSGIDGRTTPPSPRPGSMNPRSWNSCSTPATYSFCRSAACITSKASTFRSPFRSPISYSTTTSRVSTQHTDLSDFCSACEATQISSPRSAFQQACVAGKPVIHDALPGSYRTGNQLCARSYSTLLSAERQVAEDEPRRRSAPANSKISKNSSPSLVIMLAGTRQPICAFRLRLVSVRRLDHESPQIPSGSCFALGCWLRCGRLTGVSRRYHGIRSAGSDAHTPRP